MQTVIVPFTRSGSIRRDNENHSIASETLSLQNHIWWHFAATCSSNQA